MEQSLTGMTILVVDDEPSLLHLLERSLTRAGARVFSASCGRDAMETLSQEQVELLFCDVHLGSKTCHEFLPQCLRVNPELKVVVTSGGTDYPEGYPFLAKPYSLQALVTLIRQTAGVGGQHRSRPSLGISRPTTKLGVHALRHPANQPPC